MVLQLSGNLPKILVHLLIICLLPGCQSANSLRDIGNYSRSSIQQNVGVGDYVQIGTSSGETYAFEVDFLGESSLRGDGVNVNYADIEKLEVRASNRGRNDGPNYVLIAVVGALIIAVMIALSDNSSGGCSLEQGILCGAQ